MLPLSCAFSRTLGWMVTASTPDTRHSIVTLSPCTISVGLTTNSSIAGSGVGVGVGADTTTVGVGCPDNMALIAGQERMPTMTSVASTANDARPATGHSHRGRTGRGG